MNNLAASRALKHCTNRFIVQRKPCHVTCLFPKWMSVLSGPESNGIKYVARPTKKAVSSLLERKTVQPRIIRRSLQQQSGKESNQGNALLVVGLGALGLVSALTYKMGIFYPDAKKVPSPAKEAATLQTDNADAEEKVESIEAVELSEDPAVVLEDAAEVSEDAAEVSETTAEVSEATTEVSEDAVIVSEDLAPPSLPQETEDSVTPVDETKVDEEQLETPAEEVLVVTSDVDVDTVLVDVVDEEVVPSSQSTAEEPAVAEDSLKAEIKLPRIPESVPYLIIGAGTASHAACRAIRKNDPTAKILIVGDEEVLPYMRPPLSKELWFSDDEDNADTLFFKQWNGKQRSVFFEDDTFYTKPQLLPTKEEGGTAVLTGHRVIEVNPIDHTVQLKHGQTIKYEKLLIATGGHPKSLPIFENVDDTLNSKVTLFRTVADYRKLDKLITNTDSVTIVGGGFLGSELACALAAKSKKNGIKVSQIYHEDGNMGKILPKYLSEWTKNKVQKEGVDIHANAEIKSASVAGDDVVLELSTGESLTTGHVVVCIGLEPNTELAASAGLEVDPDHGGFRVNSELQARSDIWIAGDVSCFYDTRLGRRRVEHHDHAVVSGRLAGQNMTGAQNSYLHQSMFWSDLGPDVGYEAIGIVDNSLDTVGVWAKATKSDSPKAAVEATGEGIRSGSEEDADTGESVPGESVPGESVPGEAVPGESVPGEAVPGEAVPVSEASDASSKSEEFGKGIVFYLKDNVVVGLLLWNIFNKMPVARKILKDGKKQTELKDLAKLFNIHD